MTGLRNWVATALRASAGLLAVVVLTSAPTTGRAQTVGSEPGTDRAGSDYARSVLPSANSELCRLQCVADARCTAYTYVKPGVHAAEAICYLKNAVPPPTASDCCVSGTKSAGGIARAEPAPSVAARAPFARATSDRLGAARAVVPAEPPFAGSTSDRVGPVVPIEKLARYGPPPGLARRAAAGARFGARNALGQGWPLPVATAQPVADGVGRVTSPLSVKRDAVWPSPVIGVCWESVAGFATERAWVRNAVATTWEAESRVRLIGWNACPASFDGIRIGVADIADDGPHVKALGTSLRNRRDGMMLNFTFMNWNTKCATTRQFCIEAIAVHEFGHALGAGHEQNRADVPDEACQDQRQGTDPDYDVTPYDLQSVMNYCNPAWNGSGRLSALDIEGIRALYGWNRSTSHEAPGVGFDGDGAGAALGDLNGNGVPDLLLMAVDSPEGDNTVRYRVGFDLGTDGAAAAWGEMYVSPPMGAFSQGGGAALADLNGNGSPDAVLMAYDNPDGPNAFVYRVAWDLRADGSPTRWGELVRVDGVGEQGDGAGAHIADVNGDGRPDLVLAAYDAPEGRNEFRYRVGFGLGPSGTASEWTSVYGAAGLGDIGQGAGVVVADVDGDCAPELVLMAYDAPSGVNNFRYRRVGPVRRDGSVAGPGGAVLTACGGSSPFHDQTRTLPGVGLEGQGGGLEVIDLDRDGWLDLILVAYDAPEGNNNFRYTVFYDVMAP